ncbi:phosphoglycerate mutase [Planococcus antarcticus DSM 14505]|uniref:Histidine phosphatase family protein n=1 Tax=Planococcus antarcticus DSM 14505 TaxID=1185653 RepID=A0A1C7DDJ5_9BACL|nr:histidine phosphatase family protein [Planococcus antarcticus]ANU09472.1 histidine phosphatase family protein [Planococcus antarcticus DSM 14505]EIM06247.1 phosphoglycerate mutase [Planococcus antarcticus DSM 14505]
MTTIGLVRHGITDWNIQGIAQGSSDVPLNETGRQQAESLANRLSTEEDWDLIISSDLSRAKETAEIIGKELDLTVSHFDTRLRERSGGKIEGTTEEERLEKWGTDWRKLDLAMENLDEATERGLACIEDILENFSGQRVLLVSHGALIGLTLQGLLPEKFKETSMDNTSITILKNAESQWDCALYNCTVHLAKSESY